MSAQGVRGDIKLLGGAALVLQGIGNRPTADIDASYADKTSVNTIVAEMATDYDLAIDWLNSNASAFIPDNAIWVTLEEFDGRTIQAADDETLLAMKIAAERNKDTLDIARLLRKLNITNAIDAVNLAFSKYGEHSIPLRQVARITSSSSTTPSTRPHHSGPRPTPSKVSSDDNQPAANMPTFIKNGGGTICGTVHPAPGCFMG